MKNKKQYEKPQMETFILFEGDVIRTSDFNVDVDQWLTDATSEPEV